MTHPANDNHVNPGDPTPDFVIETIDSVPMIDGSTPTTSGIAPNPYAAPEREFVPIEERLRRGRAFAYRLGMPNELGRDGIPAWHRVLTPPSVAKARKVLDAKVEELRAAGAEWMRHPSKQIPADVLAATTEAFKAARLARDQYDATVEAVRDDWTPKLTTEALTARQQAQEAVKAADELVRHWRLVLAGASEAGRDRAWSSKVPKEKRTKVAAALAGLGLVRDLVNDPDPLVTGEYLKSDESANQVPDWVLKLLRERVKTRADRWGRWLLIAEYLRGYPAGSVTNTAVEREQLAPKAINELGGPVSALAALREVISPAKLPSYNRPTELPV